MAKRSNDRLRAFILLAGATLWPGAAQAHIKWFAAFDVKVPPMPVGDVLTAQFIIFFLASVLLIYAFFWLDRFVLRKNFLQAQLRRYTVSEPVAFIIMRVAAFLFFTAVGIHGLADYAFFLTPEMKTTARWVPWLQIAMAWCALHHRTVPLIGLGVAALYLAAMAQYGVFHLLDYFILIGVAYYFAAVPMSGPGWLMSRYIALYAATALTLLWAAFEKWGYPGWTYPLLAREPDLLMGLDPRTYMVLAGFVEFNLAFMVLSGVSLLARAVTLGLAAIFVLAIAKFGMIDAIGHSLIIAILFVLVVHGPTKGRDFLVLGQKSLWTEAYFMTGLYILAFVLIAIAYYGFHFLIFGN